MDTTWYLSSYLGDRGYPLGDYMNWTNAQFEAVRDSPGYKMAVQSWLDQRNYLSSAVNLLEQSDDNKYVQLAKEMRDAVQSTAPSLPDLDDYVKVDTLNKNKTFSCQGIICTEHAQRTGGYINCHHHSMAIIMVNGGAQWLVFDPMKRQQIKHEPGATAETNAASFSKFEKRKDAVRFVTRRLANMDVTEFTYSVLSRNNTNRPYDTFLRAEEQKEFEETGFLDGGNADEKIGIGGQDLSSTLNDDPKGSSYSNTNDIDTGKLESILENNGMKERVFAANARQKNLLLAENLLTSRRKSIFRDALTAGVSTDLSNTYSERAGANDSSVIHAVLHWKTLYICLIQSMWHIPAFRYHFVRGRPVPTAGAPVRCIVKALHVLMKKFDTHLTAVLGDSVMLGDGIKFRRSGVRTSRSSDVMQIERTIYGTHVRHGGESRNNDREEDGGSIHGEDSEIDDEESKGWREYKNKISGVKLKRDLAARANAMKAAIQDMRSPFQKRRDRARKLLGEYLESSELNMGLTNLHQNLDNISLAELDPGSILSNFLQASHSAATGTIAREDPRSRCSCYEPPHSGAVAQSEAAKGTGLASMAAGAAVAESKSIDFSQAAQREVPHYMSFVHRVKVTHLRRVFGIHSVEHNAMESLTPDTSSKNNNKGAKIPRFDDILRQSRKVGRQAWAVNEEAWSKGIGGMDLIDHLILSPSTHFGKKVLEKKFKVLRLKKRDEKTRIESSWRMPQGVDDTRDESQKDEAKKRAKMKASQVDNQLQQIKAEFQFQKQQLLARKTREVNRKMSAMLRSRRNAMTMTSPHVKHPLTRPRQLASSVMPCPINSTSKTMLRSAPSVFTVALDWPDSEPSGPEINQVCALLVQDISLDRVFHEISPRPQSTEATWSSLLLLLVRSDTADRICQIMNEMIAFAMTKPVPHDFPMKLAGVAYMKSNGVVGKKDLTIESIVQGDNLAAFQQRHKTPQPGGLLKHSMASENLGSGQLNVSAASVSFEISASFGEEQNAVSVMTDRQMKNKDGSTWNAHQNQIYERLMDILLCAVKSGNASHSLSNLNYRPCSMVCRKINDRQSGLNEKMKDSTRQIASELDKDDDKNKTQKIKVRHGRYGEAQSARSKMFRYMDSEIAELQQHTSYFFHLEKRQWCQMDKRGAMQFMSTAALLKTMEQNSEYPILIFYDRIPSAGAKLNGSSTQETLGGAIDSSLHKEILATSFERFGEMNVALNKDSTEDLTKGILRSNTATTTHDSKANREENHPSSRPGRGGYNRESCSGNSSCLIV
eukprot:g4310.t1